MKFRVILKINVNMNCLKDEKKILSHWCGGGKGNVREFDENNINPPPKKRKTQFNSWQISTQKNKKVLPEPDRDDIHDEIIIVWVLSQGLSDITTVFEGTNRLKQKKARGWSPRVKNCLTLCLNPGNNNEQMSNSSNWSFYYYITASSLISSFFNFSCSTAKNWLLVLKCINPQWIYKSSLWLPSL